MIFTTKNEYKDGNMLTRYYIDGKEVSANTYYALEEDQFNNLTNILPNENRDKKKKKENINDLHLNQTVDDCIDLIIRACVELDEDDCREIISNFLNELTAASWRIGYKASLQDVNYVVKRMGGK